ncbi:MAG: hypothetical protein WC488_02060 [Candidatus Micrarchaeia archaeon]
MENGASSEARTRIYELIISRYKELIEQNEHKSVSELRERISPYNEFIRKLNERLSEDLKPYEYERDFEKAVRNCINYIKGIENVEPPVSFWIDFETMDRLKAGDVTDQALLLASLLRSFGSPTAKVLIARSRKIYVGYEWKGEQHIINPESGSLLSGEDVQKLFLEDPLAYAFSDFYFETYGEE